MSDKKTFPGAVSAEQRAELARQKAAAEKAAAEKARIAAEQAEQAAKVEAERKAEQKRRQNLINKFDPKPDTKIALTIACFVVMFNYMVGGIDRYFADYVNERDFGTDIDVQVGPDLGPAIREAYNPCFHGEVNP